MSENQKWGGAVRKGAHHTRMCRRMRWIFERLVSWVADGGFCLRWRACGM